MPHDEEIKANEREKNFKAAQKEYLKDLLTAYLSLKNAMEFLIDHKLNIAFFNSRYDSYQERTDLLELIQHFERFCDNHELHRIIGYKEN